MKHLICWLLHRRCWVHHVIVDTSPDSPLLWSRCWRCAILWRRFHVTMRPIPK